MSRRENRKQIRDLQPADHWQATFGHHKKAGRFFHQYSRGKFIEMIAMVMRHK